jgi:hypothetical protein
MGMSIPGATGNMYARHGAPSKGPHRNQTDVTDASAQNGQEMRYYQQGLDWKPKSISQNGYNFDKINIREVPRGVVNDNIPNASQMAINQDEKFIKGIQYAKNIAIKKTKEQKEAENKFKALPKAEQERILYEQYNQEHGSISEYKPNSTLSKVGQSMVLPFTALKDLYNNGEVRDNLLRSVANDPKSANAYDAAYLGALGYAAAPYVASGATSVASAVSPYLAADAVVGGTTLTGVNLNNLITAGFATHGAMNIAPDTEEWLDNPSWEKAGEVGIDALEMLPVVGPASKTIGEGFNAVKNINTSISPELMEGLNTAGPSFRSSVNNVGNNVSNYIKNVKGLATNETQKIQSELNEILYADSDIYASKEYLENQSRLSELRQLERDMFNKLDVQKMPQYLPEQSKLSKQINFKENRINTANSLKLTDEGLVQSGKDTSLGLRTGSTDIVNLETGVSTPISTSVPNEDVLFKLEGDQVTKTLNTGTEVKVTPEYTSTVKDNIDFIEKQIPGAKVFGSAKNVAEAEVPHIIGDYDVLMSQTQYDKFAKTNPEVGTNGFAKVHNIPGAAEGIEPIDVNVIQEINGKAIGQRAQELFRQVAPDDFYKAAQEAIKNKSDIKIPYSSQELIEMTNPSSKSVVDAYESTKAKHLNKIDALINYGKPSVVTEGQQQYVKSLVGSKGSIGPQFPAEQLSDVATNETILDRINFIGNKKLVAANPERMQLALNDYYINNSVLVRQVDEGPIDKIEAAIKEYHPQAGGGAANGIGQNHVTLGFPNHGFGNITAVKQIGMDLDTTSPLAYLDDFEHQTSGSKLFTEDEQKILQDIVNDIKGTQTGDYNSFDDIAKMTAMNSKNSSELIERLPYSEEGKQALYDFAKQTNRQLVKKDYNYGTSNYTSTLRDFDEAIDAMKYSGLDQVEMNRVLKSFSERTQGAQSTPSRLIDEILPKQYKGIKGYLEGGIDRATERLARLQEERSRLGNDIQKISQKVYVKKYKEEIDRIKSYQENISKQIQELNTERVQLRQRIVDLNKFKDDFTKHILLTTGVGTLAGLTKLYQYEMSDEYKASRTKEWEESVKENAEKEKKLQKMSPEERKKAEYEDKPFLDKTYDWFMGDKNENDVAPTPTPFNEPVYGSPRKNGGIVNSDRGQWDHPGKVTRIKGGNITMKRDPKTGKALTQPILGIANTGERQWMYPGQDYQFQNAEYVTEYPKGKLAKNGNELVKLDQLTNFTNYNKPQPGGWLNKYN